MIIVDVPNLFVDDPKSVAIAFVQSLGEFEEKQDIIDKINNATSINHTGLTHTVWSIFHNLVITSATAPMQINYLIINNHLYVNRKNHTLELESKNGNLLLTSYDGSSWICSCGCDTFKIRYTNAICPNCQTKDCVWDY